MSKVKTALHYKEKMVKIYNSGKTNCGTNWNKVFREFKDTANEELKELGFSSPIQYLSINATGGNKRAEKIIEIYEELKGYQPRGTCGSGCV